MDTRFLESFVSVVESGSIAAAARRLNLTPAAVAQRIRTLEQEIGTELLARTGRTVLPTPAGARIVQPSRQFLREVRDLKALALGDRIEGELQLGAVATALNGLLPDVLARLSEKYPGLNVHVVPGASDMLYQGVVDGKLDAAVLVEPEFALPKTCAWTVLRKERLVVLTPKSMAVLDAHEALRSAPFIRYDRGTIGGRIADKYLRRIGVQPKERFELTSLTAIALLVDRGLGVSLVPDWSPPWPEGLSLNKLAVRGRQLERRIGLIWSKNSARVRLVEALHREAAASVHSKTSGRLPQA